ncbi:MAG TPA: transglutaminase family protein [Candidatus Thermoplasmatota archaeon]|nr:transglutaminase family protein [Candidatus Thermoplasmatota archaeon]
MRIRIAHRTAYSYSAPVRLDPQVVRLKPATDARQRLLSWALAVDPADAKVAEALDASGFWATTLATEAGLERFVLETESLVETMPLPPIDSAPRLPWRDPALLPEGARAWRLPRDEDPEVVRFALDVAQGASWETLPFLGDLARRIHTTHQHRVRHEGSPWTPRATLDAREGACRDFAVLFVAACRLLGVPARFVSGYRVIEATRQGQELHAWAEAWIPGHGWRGFDPTDGRPVEDRHVAVAAGSVAEAAPVTGTFWGPAGVVSRLETRVDARIE